MLLRTFMYYLLLISVMSFNFCLIKSFILFKSPYKSFGSFFNELWFKIFSNAGWTRWIWTSWTADLHWSKVTNVCKVFWRISRLRCSRHFIKLVFTWTVLYNKLYWETANCGLLDCGVFVHVGSQLSLQNRGLVGTAVQVHVSQSSSSTFPLLRSVWHD